MTREEIIRNLKYTMEKHKNDTVNTFDTNILVMCKDILDYLEQEPSGDVISRQAVLDLAYTIKTDDYSDNQLLDIVEVDDIKALSPVKPQTGHWIKGKCDQCGGHAPFWSMATTYYESEYCPHCGAKMEVEQNG